MRKIYTLLCSLLLCLVAPFSVKDVDATTQEDAVGFSVQAVLPDNQTNADVTYFDLLVSPGDEQVLEVKIFNHENQTLKVNVTPTTASTNRNALIVYEPQETYDDSLAYPISELITVEDNQITVPANDMVTVELKLTVPEEPFDGIMLGGLHFEKEPTEEDTDFDIDDVRYSVITYVASPKSNAMGPAVIDPRSGQILESDIIWWHNVMTSLHSWMRIQTGPIDPKARGNKFDDEHMGEAIRFVSSHEVGHTFGLKHNMGASYAYPVDSLRSKKFTEEMGGTAPSIMDYARYNYVAQPEDGVTAITPKIGVYDKYAIEWGYRWYPTKEMEEKALRELIAKHEDDPKYFYGEQQPYLNIIDPRSQSEDLGDDAVLASEYGVKNLKRVIDNLLDWTYEDGESYYEAGKLYIGTIGQWQMYNKHVLANIGGVYLDHAVFGNGKNAYDPVPYDTQVKSIDYLTKNVFEIPKWLFFNEILEKTYALKDSPVGPYEYTPYTLARELQYTLIYELLMDERLLRLTESELIQSELNGVKTFTVSDLFNKTFCGRNKMPYN